MRLNNIHNRISLRILTRGIATCINRHYKLHNTLNNQL